MKDKVMRDLDEVKREIDPAFFGARLYDLRISSQYALNPVFRARVERAARNLGKYESLMATVSLLDRLIHKRNLMETELQSDAAFVFCVADRCGVELQSDGQAVGANDDGTIDPATISVKQNVQDVAGDVEANLSYGYMEDDSTFIGTPLELSDFLARPIPVTSFDIKYDTDLDYSVDIWDLFLMNPTIRAKLRNYAYLRGDLNVRITVSGTPFDYGYLQVAYIPLKYATPIAGFYEANVAVGGMRECQLRYNSQTPGCTTINVNENQPLEMVIPYISPAPMIRLFNKDGSSLSASTPYDDAVSLGRLYIKTLNQIKQTNTSGSSAVSVYVYAWMENVQLGCPTGTIIQVDTESERDERVTGPVEKWASRAASFLMKFTRIPAIEPYARASSMVASAVASVSSLFGWSVPTINTQPSRMKNEPFQNMANTIGYDTGKRITLDPKQELTVDPRCCGDDTDEMVISAMTGRESYLTTFEWSPSDEEMGAPIWTCLVNPSAGIITTTDDGKLYQPTAVAFAARPFRVWRGSMEYRFQIAASKFHRGKLAIVYEPNVCQYDIINAVLNTNKQYLGFIDINQTQDVSFCVRWAAGKAWLYVSGFSDVLVNPPIVSTAQIDYCNGYILVVPMTKLQSPDDGNLPINVYVSSPDMCFNELRYGSLPVQPWTIPSSISIAEDKVELQSENSSTRPRTCLDLNPVPSSMKGIAEEYYGELPISFKALLHRFQNTYRHFSGTTSATESVRVVVNENMVIPKLTPSLGAGNTFSEPMLLNYLRAAYLGIRGGIRKRVFLTGSSGTMSVAKVHTNDPAGVITPSTNVVNPDNTDAYVPMLHGTVEYIPHTNGGVEFELPFYAPVKFGYSQLPDPFDATDPIMMPIVQRSYRVTVPIDSYVNGDLMQPSLLFEEESSVAEDFTLIRFLAAAPVYVP